MLTQRPSRVNPFTRHDAGRLFVSASVLIIAVAAIFAVDIVPSGLGLKVGEVPKDDVVAPGTIQFTSEIQTQAAREAASAAVLPQYDYTTAQGADVADQQAAAFASEVAPVDAAFDASVTAAQRAELLKSVLPDLTAASRTTLEGLTTASWKAVRDEAARVLDVIERPELRDSDVASVRAGLANRILGNLTADREGARGRADRAAPRPQLVVQPAAHRPGPSRRRPGRPAGHRRDPAGRGHRRQGPPDHARADGEGRRLQPQRADPRRRPAQRLHPPGGAPRRASSSSGSGGSARRCGTATTSSSSSGSSSSWRRSP